jgi:predicted O-methyltransferase YrrM
LVSVDIIDVNDASTKPWSYYGAAHSPAEVLESHGLTHLVEFHAEPSLSFLKRDDSKFDFIFLDGDHHAATVYQEVPAALRRLNPGGVLLLHDYFPLGKPLWQNGSVVLGPYLGIERLKSEGYVINVTPLGELPWETKLGSHRTSLAIVVKV